MLRRSFHQMFHLFCLVSVAFFMPLSVWLVSVFSLALAVNWILGLDYRNKTRILRERKELLLLPALFLMYIIWLINTSFLNQALPELKIKLSLLLFPLFAGATGKLSGERFRLIMLSFISGCLIAVIAGYAALAGLIPVRISDSRELALFLPSIRLSILINLAIFSALYLSVIKKERIAIIRFMLPVAALVMTVFLFRLLSVTGIIIFVLASAISAVYYFAHRENRIMGIAIALTAAVAAIIFIRGMSVAWNKLHNPAEPEINIVSVKTPSGHPYLSLPGESLVENGYLVWNNVCEEELRREWNKRSSISYDSTDNAGNDLRVTLIRYISYLGMKKDSSAVVHLSQSDIQNVENGFANPLYADIGNPAAKWYEIAWQIDRHLKGANPSGHSVTQRLEFYKAAFAIVLKNPVTGTGTGDVRNAFDLQYETSGTPLTPEYRLMAHNQYLTFAITFGIPGVILALILMISPALLARRRLDYLFVIFLAIIFISMFNDDTFESAIGTTFFSYFYTLLLLKE